jgi:undecaprenyl-diphosphatase
MKKKNTGNFYIAISMLGAFVLWTAVVSTIDVQAIGPQGSPVGLATMNRFFHHLTGVHMSLYLITDWLGLIPLIFAMGFACLGLAQCIRRKHPLKVDFSILILGGFYIVVMAVYVLFEIFVVNYRPVLIDGILEASYPSSTSMLVMCVMPTAIMQLAGRIKNHIPKRGVTFAITAFTAFMVIARLVSGVHWLTDIVGGALLSAGLVLMYRAVIGLEAK